MKRLASVLMVLGLVMGLTGWFGTAQPAVAADMSHLTVPTTSILAVTVEERRNTVEDLRKKSFGEQIDLNNANIREFFRFPGMAPTLAGKIITAAKFKPFESVDEVYKISDLTAHDKEILDKYKDKLVVSPPVTANVEGGDRYNNGIYDDVK